MRYIHYYESPIGQILLTADEQGLTGLLLQGEDWSLAKSHQVYHGWTYIFQETSLISYLPCVYRAPLSSWKCGNCSLKSHTVKSLPTVTWQNILQRTAVSNACLHRQ